jgi:hypothetical protein
MLGIDWSNSVLAPLIVAAITAIFTAVITRRRVRARHQARIDAAPRKYVAALDSLISRGITEGITNAIINGRAIVAARNNLRSSLVSIAGYLNSEIDRLSGELGQSFIEIKGLDPSRAQNPDPLVIYESIQVLSRIWPSKKEQIEVEIRKVLVELGLSASAVKPPPEDMPPPNARVPRTPISPIPTPSANPRVQEDVYVPEPEIVRVPEKVLRQSGTKERNRHFTIL